jgi:hypothetical protein
MICHESGLITWGLFIFNTGKIQKNFQKKSEKPFQKFLKTQKNPEKIL